MRTMPMPPGPGGVAMAAIVSVSARVIPSRPQLSFLACGSESQIARFQRAAVEDRRFLAFCSEWTEWCGMAAGFGITGAAPHDRQHSGPNQAGAAARLGAVGSAAASARAYSRCSIRLLTWMPMWSQGRAFVGIAVAIDHLVEVDARVRHGGETKRLA